MKMRYLLCFHLLIINFPIYIVADILCDLLMLLDLTHWSFKNYLTY